MKTGRHLPAQQILTQARHSLDNHHLPRIAACLKLLSQKEIWWRANPSSNSVGNLVLHLEGNVRQWIVSGLGEAPDRRKRDLEFSERGPINRRELLKRLQKTIGEAVRVLEGFPARELERRRTIQGFRVTALQAVQHVVEHFAYHSGQIIFATKLMRGTDLGFTRLPGEKPRTVRKRNLPAL